MWAHKEPAEGTLERSSIIHVRRHRKPPAAFHMEAQQLVKNADVVNGRQTREQRLERPVCAPSLEGAQGSGVPGGSGGGGGGSGSHKSHLKLGK